MSSNRALLPNNFDKDPRRQQELAMRPHADTIYAKVFGITTGNIHRHDSPDDERHLLDRLHAIDVTVTLPSGMVINGQEKFLSHEYLKYKSLTVEYYQNPKTKERGDWFNLAAQFYMVGYANADGTGFATWSIINWPSLVMATHNGAVVWQDNDNKNGKARASFRYISFDKIPQACVIAEYPKRSLQLPDLASDRQVVDWLQHQELSRLLRLNQWLSKRMSELFSGAKSA